MARLAAVTGATGFLGGYIVAALVAAGWQVRILARRAGDFPQLAGLGIETVRGDLADRPALDRLIDGADAVIHAAGAIKARHEAAFRAANAGGTETLVAALNACSAPKQLVLVSSMVAREPGLSHYARTKRESEAALSALNHGNWTVVRPCAVYGPWDRETLAIFQSAVRGIFPIAGGGRGRVALIHASDVAQAIAALCGRSGAGEIFELTDRRVDGYGWGEIAGAAEKAVGNRVRSLALPAIAVHAAAAANALAARLIGGTPMLTPGKAREILHGDWGSAAERQPPPELWQPGIGLETGFRDTVTWYRDRGWLPGRRRQL